MFISIFSGKSKENISFEYMYEKYKNLIYYLICKSTINENMREDVMQEIFIKYYKSMDRVKGEKDAKNWLYVIAHNEIINYGKKETTYRKHILLDIESDKLIHLCAEMYGRSALDETLKNEMERKIAENIYALKPIHKEVIVMKYYYGYTPMAIASILKCSVNTVYSRLSRAEEILHNALYEYIKDISIEKGAGK